MPRGWAGAVYCTLMNDCNNFWLQLASKGVSLIRRRALTCTGLFKASLVHVVSWWPIPFLLICIMACGARLPPTVTPPCQFTLLIGISSAPAAQTSAEVGYTIMFLSGLDAWSNKCRIATSYPRPCRPVRAIATQKLTADSGFSSIAIVFHLGGNVNFYHPNEAESWVIFSGIGLCLRPPGQSQTNYMYSANRM